MQMAAQTGSHHCGRQHGAALLAILVIVSVVGIGLFFRRLSDAEVVSARDRATQLALRDAKDALIAYAATSSTPGVLPCPENTSLVGGPLEGSQGTTCTNAAMAIGRLPWRSLKIEQLRDGWGEPLWYAISPGFRGGTPINTNTVGQLAVATQRYAAIIFAAGPPQSGQNRSVVTSSAPPAIADYLDGENANGDMVFAAAGASINDRLTGVTVAELTAPIVRRALAEIRGPEATFGLRRYYTENGTYPDADTDSIPDGWENASAPSGKLPWRNMTLPKTPTPPPTIAYLTVSIFDASAHAWLQGNDWFSLTSYQRTSSPSSATISIGTTSITVTP